MTYLVQILLPLYDNAGVAFPASEYVRLRGELADRFGGVTAYTRAPARGVWKDDATGETQRDDIVIFEVMTDTLDHQWWTSFRHQLEKRFRQDTLIVRALNSTLI